MFWFFQKGTAVFSKKCHVRRILILSRLCDKFGCEVLLCLSFRPKKMTITIKQPTRTSKCLQLLQFATPPNWTGYMEIHLESYCSSWFPTYFNMIPSCLIERASRLGLEHQIEQQTVLKVTLDVRRRTSSPNWTNGFLVFKQKYPWVCFLQNSQSFLLDVFSRHIPWFFLPHWGNQETGIRLRLAIVSLSSWCTFWDMVGFNAPAIDKKTWTKTPHCFSGWPLVGTEGMNPHHNQVWFDSLTPYEGPPSSLGKHVVFFNCYCNIELSASISRGGCILPNR